MTQWIFKPLFFYFIVNCALITSSYSLVPLESLIMGDFSSQKYSSELESPLDHIFSQSLNVEGFSDDDAVELAQLYRGFYERGHELNQFCQASPSIDYSASWNKLQAQRSAIANLQYIGLDVVVRAIAAYANYFEFSEIEYENLIENMVGNFCSQNITIISLKQLRSNFKMHFDKQTQFTLPSVENNPLLPNSLMRGKTLDEVRKREFKLTLDLFKSFCSWGNDPENVRLLVPVLRNPQIMAFVFRQMNSEVIRWNRENENLALTEVEETTKVLCRGLICRRETNARFDRDFPRSIGSTSIRNDMSRLYCNELRYIDFQLRGQDHKIRNFIDQWNFDEQNFMVSHLISLITGVPDLFLWADHYNDAVNFTRASLDEAWSRWANEQTEQLDQEIYYEESLTTELISRESYFNKFEGEFRIEFDVDLGEYDRVHQRSGKLSVSFHLEISQSLLKWARTQYMSSRIDDDELRESVVERLELIIDPQIQRAYEHFEISPWEGDLTKIVVDELVNQLNITPNFVMDQLDDGLTSIPIVFNYGPFALNYLSHLRDVDRERKRREEIVDIVEKTDQLEILD